MPRIPNGFEKVHPRHIHQGDILRFVGDSTLYRVVGPTVLGYHIHSRYNIPVVYISDPANRDTFRFAENESAAVVYRKKLDVSK
jgi:hypothetical protein